MRIIKRIKSNQINSQEIKVINKTKFSNFLPINVHYIKKISIFIIIHKKI